MHKIAILLNCLLLATSPGPLACNAPPAPPPAISGSYFCGGGFGGESLDLWPNGSYRLISESDVFVPDDRTNERGKSFGSYYVHDGTLVVVPKDGQRRLRSLQAPQQYIPVRWGARRYLIPEAKMELFCHAIEQGEEPSKPGAWPSFFMRSGDNKVAAAGTPQLPYQWKKYEPRIAVAIKRTEVVVLNGLSPREAGSGPLPIVGEASPPHPADKSSQAAAGPRPKIIHVPPVNVPPAP